MAANEPYQGHIYNPLLAASIRKGFFFFFFCSEVLKVKKTNQTPKKKNPNQPQQNQQQQTFLLKVKHLCDFRASPLGTWLSGGHRKGPSQITQTPLIFPSPSLPGAGSFPSPDLHPPGREAHTIF